MECLSQMAMRWEICRLAPGQQVGGDGLRGCAPVITQQDLQEAIAECKGQRNPTASTCMKLAAYYTISDHMRREHQIQIEPTPGVSTTSPHSFASAPRHGSEFLEAAGRLDPDVVTEIMDELMETLRAIHPRLYDGVMAKLTL